MLCVFWPHSHRYIPILEHFLFQALITPFPLPEPSPHPLHHRLFQDFDWLLLASRLGLVFRSDNDLPLRTALHEILSLTLTAPGRAFSFFVLRVIFIMYLFLCGVASLDRRKAFPKQGLCFFLHNFSPEQTKGDGLQVGIHQPFTV